MPDLNLEKCASQLKIDIEKKEPGYLFVGLLKTTLQRNKPRSKNEPEGCNDRFQFFSLMNAMFEQLEKLNNIEEYTERKCELFCKCINFYIPINSEELFASNNGKITAINWQNVKYKLLLKLRDEDYVTLSAEENALLEFLQNKMPSDANIPAMALDANVLDRLIPHGYELVQCLKFFSEWTMEQQVNLVLAYLQNKSLNEQKEFLTLLKNEVPQLTSELKTQPDLQTPYFKIAIAENDITAVRTYIDKGADIHAELLRLFVPEHYIDTLDWLHVHPEHLQKLTAESLNAVMPYGTYQDKTIAEILVLTQKGCKLLLENASLQAVFSQTTIGDRLSSHPQKAQRESNNQMGFFKSSLTTELVQAIVYGNLEKAEKILKAHPTLSNTLLTEEATVEDYSGRTVKQMTAFQAALCAWDNEMCEMLAKYMSKEEMREQYYELFPEGHESYYSAQTSFDFSQIVEAINQSNNDEDLEKALNLELPNHTPLWEKLEQFRAAFTQHSCQEEVFNPQHLLKAFELYDSQFDNWSKNQRYLFFRQVIGYTQRFLPANIAMDFAQGLYRCEEGYAKPRRSFNFRHGMGSIFPLSAGASSGLGYEFCASSGCGSRVDLDHGRFPTFPFFKTYVKKKHHHWKNYSARAGLQPFALGHSVK